MASEESVAPGSAECKVAPPFVVGNWKMHKTIAEAVDFTGRLRDNLAAAPPAARVVIAPPFTALHAVARTLAGSPIGLAAQNVSQHAAGAFTGEVSASMVREAGCSHVIVGHSERRALFGETDAVVGAKVRAALSAGLSPIVCVGETAAQRDAGEAFIVLERQVTQGLQNFGADDMGRLVIAYEPIWAIGTGKTATAAQADEAHAVIRGVIAGQWGQDTAGAMVILYGGSVTPGNIGALMAQPEIGGVLVGGASLDFASFISIVRF